MESLSECFSSIIRNIMCHYIHIEYSGENAVIQIPESTVIAGKIPNNKLKLVQAWIEIHKDELMADWKLAVEGQQTFRIEALK